MTFFLLSLLFIVILIVINYSCYGWLVDFLKGENFNIDWKLSIYVLLLIFAIPICILIIAYGLVRQLLNFSVRR